jgi:hypothetical protein
MLEFAFLLFAWKVVVKNFRSVLDVLHGQFKQAFLKCGMDLVLQFQNLQA